MHVLNVVLPIFLVIGLGQVLRRAGFFDDRVAAAVSRLVFYVAAPALLARATAVNSLGETFNLPVFAVYAAVSVLVMGGTYLLCFRSARSRRGVIAQGAFRANQVFVGLPVVIYAYGEESVHAVAVLISFTVILYNFLGVVALVMPQEGVSARSPAVLARTAMGVARNPLIIACTAGILYSLTGLPLPVALDRALDLVGGTAAPLALVAVGAGMDLRRVRADLRTTVAVSLAKTLVYPALGYAGFRALGLAGADVNLPVMIMAAPTAVVSYIMARELEGDADLAAAIIVGSTLLSLVTITVWLIFLG